MFQLRKQKAGRARAKLPTNCHFLALTFMACSLRNLIPMEFFFPGIGSANEAEAARQRLAKDVEEATSWAVALTQVYAIRYRVQDREFLAQVGIEHPPFSGETPVRAIFQTPTAFLICTGTHGTGSTLPMIVNRQAVSDVEDFNGVDDAVPC